MYIASSQTNGREICKMYLQRVCDRKLEGVAAEHLAWALPSHPRSASPGLLAPGVCTEEEEEEAARHHAGDGGENVAENKGEREEWREAKAF